MIIGACFQLSTIPPNEKAYFDVARTWAERDPTQAAAWVATLPAGSTRDAAVAGQSEAAGETDPARAVAKANTIGNAAERTYELKTLIFKWAQKDHAKAAAAIPGLSLSDYDKKELMKSIH